MNEQDKKLVFRYLSMALPYNVIVDRLGDVKPLESCKITKNGTMVVETNNYPYTSKTYLVEDVKPHLRPMSSMTVEEKNELAALSEYNGIKIISWVDETSIFFRFIDVPIEIVAKIMEWLLKNHFDFMGLIEKGLAIKVIKENNPYEKRD